MRIVAFDVGERRIGVAVSDALGYTAQGLETYVRKADDTQADVKYLTELAGRYAPAKLLFGLPRNMNGSYGFQAEKVRDFAQQVQEAWDGEIVFFDERLTTAAAERLLISGDVRRDKRKKVIDKMAAVIILEDYLSRYGNA